MWFKKHKFRLCAFFALALIYCPAPVLAQVIEKGFVYLSSSQDFNAGTWGNPDGSLFRDSTVVLETFKLHGQGGSSYTSGLAGAAALEARNNDDRARQGIILSNTGPGLSVLSEELLASQNPDIFDPAQRDFPGLGWGIAPGFGNSTLDTALALRALQAEGLNGVLSVVNENISALATSPTHPFTVIAGGSGLLLKIRNVTGGNLKFLIQQPAGGTFFVDIPNGGAPANIALPFSAGNWNLWVENQSGTTASYTVDMAFTDAGGFSQFRITSPLLYLGLAQNPDGGWGIAPGEDSNLMVTNEVLRTLVGAGNAFVGGQTMAAAASWLGNLQNVDGGFSSVPNSSNINESSLAVVGLGLAAPGTNLLTAADYLKGLQQIDGSWGSDAYLTAIAMQALRYTGLSLTPLIFKDSFE